jgi:hypothetical protein
MDEIIKLVAARTGLSPAAARMAVELVIEQLKGKLSGPLGTQLASQLDTILGLKGEDHPLGQVVKGLGGLFGGRKKPTE